MIIIRQDLPRDSCESSRFSKGKSRYSKSKLRSSCLSKKLPRENMHSIKREIERWIVRPVLESSRSVLLRLWFCSCKPMVN